MKTPDIKRRERKGRPEALGKLIGGGTRASAALAAGVSRRTLDRWAAEPDFKAELEAGRRAAFDAALDVLKGLSAKAVKTLGGLLNSKLEAERRHAAVEILSFALKANETLDMEARIAALEKRAGEYGHMPGSFHRACLS
ncbi:MAG: hypothetical protein ABSG19_13735 [Candidatus Aminicenantales bacterium]